MISRKNRRLRQAAAERVLEHPQGDAPGEITTCPDEDPGFASEIEAIRAMTELLAEVPAEAWQPIPAMSADAAPASRRHPRPVRLSRTLAGIAAAACLALGFAGGAVLEGGSGGSASRPANPTANGPAVVLHPLSSASAKSLAVAYMPGPGQMLLRVAHLPPSPPGTYYELWLMTDVRHLAPVAAFRIGLGGRAALSLRLPDDSHRYIYLDTSRQRIGGGTAHSGDSVLRGRLA